MIRMPNANEPVTLIQGDSLDVLREMPDGLNCILTDPPYGTGGNVRRSKGTSKSWDREKVRHAWDQWNSTWLLESLSLAQNVTLFCPDVRLAEVMAIRSDWRLLMWCKTDPMPLWNGGPSFGTESIVAFKKLRKTTKPNWFAASTPRAERDADYTGHPYQKPLALMKWLVEICCPPGGIVVDPFMGSGTTGVACIQTGRRFIGIELDPTHFAIARRRIDAALGVNSLFPPAKPQMADLFEDANQ